MAKKKQKSKLDKITKVVVWVMVVATLVGVGVPAVMALQSFFK